jgi:hypothetical protein
VTFRKEVVMATGVTGVPASASAQAYTVSQSAPTADRDRGDERREPVRDVAERREAAPSGGRGQIVDIRA